MTVKTAEVAATESCNSSFEDGANADHRKIKRAPLLITEDDHVLLQPGLKRSTIISQSVIDVSDHAGIP